MNRSLLSKQVNSEMIDELKNDTQALLSFIGIVENIYVERQDKHKERGENITRLTLFSAF